MDESTKDELDRLRIETQADLQRMWQLLIQPLGFTHGSLWVSCIGADRRPLHVLAEIADADAVPGDREVDNLFATFEQALQDQDRGWRLAFLISRPGARPVGRHDSRFALALIEGGRRNSTPMAPVHVANDVEIRPVTPDDLAA